MNNKLKRIGAICGVAIVIVIILIFMTSFTIANGEIGVMYDPLRGGVQQAQFGQGFHIKAPWQSITVFNTKTQAYTMSIAPGQSTLKVSGDEVRTVTREGLYIGLDMTVLFNIDPNAAWKIFNTLGKEGEYQTNIIRPMIRSTIRSVVSQHDAADVYGSQKQVVENEIFDSLNSQLSSRFIRVENVLLRDVQLPDELTKSITAKKQAEQDAQAMQYVIQKAQLEKQRAVIEAEGIAQANKVIADSLTSSYLNWYWIDKLDKSNSVIYVPTEGGLPLFKDVDKITK